MARVRLLGEFALRTAEGESVVLDSARAESLLAYVALRRNHPHSRQQLAVMLWPDSTEAQARTNLRHLLHTMRHRAAACDVLDITARTIGWRAAVPCRVDAAEFEAALDRAAELDDEARRAGLTAAVEAYTGDLLSDHYDEWLHADRERLRGRFVTALEQLGVLLHGGGDHDAAAGVLERLLREDPLRESAYLLLMRTYDARGDRARALRTYHLCASTLERELGVAPAAATRAAYAALLPDAPPTGHDRPEDAPLVGRAAQRRALTDTWRATLAGHTQLVLLTGEPGIGKTRLAEGFAGWCARQGAVTAVARAHAAEGTLSYAPVAAWLRSPAIRCGYDRLSPTQLVELARLLPELLASRPGLGTPELLQEDEQRRRLFDAATSALLATGRPVVLVADDLHRFDRESLRLLHYLLRTAPAGRLLVVATARLEEVDRDHPVQHALAGLRGLGRVVDVELSALNLEETAALADRVTGGALDAQQVAGLYAETEGNPLFLVEALRAGWPASRMMSPKVQAVIEARFSRLSATARQVLEVAATAGREFTIDMLTGTGVVAGDDIVTGLDELWLRRIVREQGVDAYDFTHDKIREVAYQEMSPVRRAAHHRKLAEGMGRAGESTRDELCGQIADHYQRSGDIVSAVPWTLRAADAAAKLHANTEAIRLLDHALEQLRSLPVSRTRNALELELLTALPGPLCAVEGYSAAAVSGVQSRALELATELDVDLEPPLVRSLALTSLTRSDFDGTRRFGEHLLERGKREHDDVLVVESAYVLGTAAFWQARFEEARDAYEMASRRYRPEHRAVHLLRYGQDPRVVCTSRLANTLWFLGKPEEASAARDAALSFAEESRHVYTRTVALVFAGLLALDMADEPLLRKYLGELTAMGNEAKHNRVAVEGMGGYLDVLDGYAAEGINRCRRAIAGQEGTESAPGMRAMLQRVLLAATQAAGDRAAALAAAETLLTMGGAGNVWRSEALRVRHLLTAANA